ncbi:tyrosine-type recombinase/integrase [Rubrimonas sp.]|uniref:tyrosine-type recombinase/integrase n=1 Tax=Rubrimonas sp. TaxID=2036015 RepID=UPI002FDD3C0A
MQKHATGAAGRAAAPVWSHGYKIGPKRALKPKEVWAIRFELGDRPNPRDRALFDLAIDSKLRGCDLVNLRIGDIVSGGQIRRRATVARQKTGRPVQFELSETTRESVLKWLTLRGGSIEEYVSTSRLHRCAHMSTRRYGRLVHAWVAAVGLNSEDYGTHSLRRTKASILYKQTGNLRAAQILLGRTRIESTVRHLGVDVEYALALSEAVDI